MKRKDIQTLLRKLGKPTQYMSWKKGQEPALPYFLFRTPGRDDKKADNQNYQKIPQWEIDLYSDTKEEELEEQLEAALKELGITYGKFEFHIETEDMILNRYSFNTLGD